MPELTWTTALAWCGFITGALTVARVILQLAAGRTSPKVWPALSADQATLRQILARLERHEEPRC